MKDQDNMGVQQKKIKWMKGRRTGEGNPKTY